MLGRLELAHGRLAFAPGRLELATGGLELAPASLEFTPGRLRSMDPQQGYVIIAFQFCHVHWRTIRYLRVIISCTAGNRISWEFPRHQLQPKAAFRLRLAETDMDISCETWTYSTIM